jgi:hypothetical protein
MHLLLVIMLSARMRGVEYFVAVEDVLFVVVSPHIRNWSSAASQQEGNLDAPHNGAK